MLHEWDMKILLIKISNTSLMSNKVMKRIGMLSMGSTTIHPGFHINAIPPLFEQGDSIGQTKDVMVYARGINHEQDNITSIVGTD